MCDKGAHVSAYYAQLQSIPERSVRTVSLPRKKFTFEQAQEWLKYHGYHERDQFHRQGPTWVFYMNYCIHPSEIETRIDKDGVKTVWQTYFIPKGADTIRTLDRLKAQQERL